MFIQSVSLIIPAIINVIAGKITGENTVLISSGFGNCLLVLRQTALSGS
jgi:hypothetical protein